MNDLRKMIYGTIMGFFLVLTLWFSIVYISSCGFTLTCHSGDHLVERTPIPTLIPVSHSETTMDMGAVEFNKCQVTALDLIGAWVSGGAPESETFAFTDANGQSCEGSFADDIQPLFVENSTWQTGSLGCVSCHNADLTERSAGLDLTSHNSILKSGVLGNSWDGSKLHEILSMGLTVDGHSTDVPASNPLIYAGTQAEVTEEEATPVP